MFQGNKNGVVNQLKNNFALRMQGIHCMVRLFKTSLKLGVCLL